LLSKTPIWSLDVKQISENQQILLYPEAIKKVHHRTSINHETLVMEEVTQLLQNFIGAHIRFIKSSCYSTILFFPNKKIWFVFVWDLELSESKLHNRINSIYYKAKLCDRSILPFCKEVSFCCYLLERTRKSYHTFVYVYYLNILDKACDYLQGGNIPRSHSPVVHSLMS